MADTATLRNTVTRIFSEHLRIDVRDPETDLIEAGLLDSLMFVDLLLHLEREFKLAVTFETLELDHFRSINRIVEFITISNGHESVAGADAVPIQSRLLPVGQAPTQSIA